MTNKIHEKLTRLKNYNVDEEVKIRLIENFYRIANLNFSKYIERFEKKSN